MSNVSHLGMAFCIKPESRELASRDVRVVMRTIKGQRCERSAHRPQIQKAVDKAHQANVVDH